MILIVPVARELIGAIGQIYGVAMELLQSKRQPESSSDDIIRQTVG
jgi:hypothetical protein